ncbi:transposase [Streptomyces sp. NPDC102402]|uniref:transposase n=1 Tax=Streptomyces sp. NPDC102402 TaxID=3366169 RepID=UPI0037F74DE0
MTDGNRDDVTQLIPLLQAVRPMPGKRGRQRRRLEVALGDRGYDHDKYRRLVLGLGVKPVIARNGSNHGRSRKPKLLRGASVHSPVPAPPPADPLGDARRHPRPPAACCP